MPVTAGVRTTLDRRRSRKRIWPAIALVCVLEVNIHELRVACRDLPGDPVGTRSASRTIVGVQEGLTGVHALKPRCGPPVDGQARDRRVPDVVRRKRGAVRSRQQLAAAAGPSRRLGAQARSTGRQHPERRREQRRDHEQAGGAWQREARICLLNRPRARRPRAWRPRFWPDLRCPATPSPIL